MRLWKLTTCALSGLLLLGIGAEAADKAKVKKVKVLGIGNSFLGNATVYKNKLNAEDPANKLIVGVALIGGCSLEKHWKLVEAHEKNPNDPKGKPYRMGKKKASLKEMLRSNKWDYVTIQQLSNLSDRPETYMPYAENLYKIYQEILSGGRSCGLRNLGRPGRQPETQAKEKVPGTDVQRFESGLSGHC